MRQIFKKQNYMATFEWVCPYCKRVIVETPTCPYCDPSY